MFISPLCAYLFSTILLIMAIKMKKRREFEYLFYVIDNDQITFLSYNINKTSNK